MTPCHMHLNAISPKSDTPQLSIPGMHNPGPGISPERVLKRPSQQVKKYKKLLMNDTDFINEFKLH